ncbi:MAG TPA: PHP domain-containing protein, partial [Solirubrobacteraceae bacterium]
MHAHDEQLLRQRQPAEAHLRRLARAAPERVQAPLGAPTFDLQSHSTYSDGELPPAQVVARAASEGVELLALTDHDTVGGVAEARRAAQAHGLSLSPAVEISAVDPLHADFHILGYEIDPADAALEERLAAFRADREGRGGRM